MTTPNELNDDYITVNEFVKMSPKIDLLVTALSLAQGQMGAAEKSSTNPHFRSKYADINSIIDASKSALAANNLSIVQSPSAHPPLIKITTIILHKSGQWMSGELTLKAEADGPQKLGSVITYGRRYALSSMLCLAQEDDDGNLASQKAPQYPAQFSSNTAPPVSTCNSVADSGDFVVPFGKHKGTPLSMMKNADIRESMDYWVTRAEKENKPLTGLPLQFFEAARAYLAKQPGPPVSPMDLNFGDDIPF